MAQGGEIVFGSDARPSVPRRFMALYAMAQLGAFIAFVPMVNILLPLKAESLDPAGKAILLSQVSLWGALAAGLTNLAAGALSDGGRGRFGRRRPWIIIGAFGVAGAHGLVFLAESPAGLLAAVLAFQVLMNIMFGPLNAVFPDKVPNHQKGLVSALMGLALPGAGLFAAVVVASVLTDPGTRFAVVAGAILLLVLPFAISLNEQPGPGREKRRPRMSVVALRDRDFLLALVSRLLVQVTISMNVLYLLFYLQETALLDGRTAPPSAEVALGWLLGGGTVAALIFGTVGGVLSDRFRRRRAFVMAGGLAMAVGAAIMVLSPSWPGPLVAQLIFGAGLGLFSTVDTALVAELLPDPENAGRDLGLMNLAITVPQILAPLAGLVLLSVSGGDLRWIFGVSGLFGVAGALVVAHIRRVR